MADVASLGLAIDSNSVKAAGADLRAFTTGATAADQAAKKYGVSMDGATVSNDNFSRRVRNVVAGLEFERQQLTRTAAEQQKYAALRRAGVAATSQEGQAILASVSALQTQRVAAASAAEAAKKHGDSMTVTKAATTAADGAISFLVRNLGPLAVAYEAVNIAHKVWAAGMKAADLGEQAEQVNVSTEALQAYRFAAVQNGVEIEQLDQGLIKLTAAMGSANRGSAESIDMFKKLGVNLLDAKGELRSTQDVLPEVARGLLAMGSETERNATLTELFGKSGARMVTMLREWAKGNDAVIDGAKAQGAVLNDEAIKAWDDLSDALKRNAAASDVTLAKLGAPIVTVFLNEVAALLERINGVMDQINSKKGFWASVLEESRSAGRIGTGPNALRLSTPQEAEADRLAALQKEKAGETDAGRQAMIQADIDRVNRATLMGQFQNQPAFQANAIGIPGAAFRPGPSTGVGSPTPKASGGGAGSDPYKKAKDSAREYILAKQAETAAVGLNAQEAARLTHTQELLNKAQTDGKTVSEDQRKALQDLGAQMAEADAKFKAAKFLDDFNRKAQDFIAGQQLERDSLFMSAQAADEMRFAQEGLNQARQQGIDQMPGVVDAVKQQAAAMAAAKAQTDNLKDATAFAKDITKGFITDVNQGLQQGKTLWDSFGNAALNALNKIADKLLELAVNDLFTKSGTGGSSSVGGFLGGLGQLLGIGGGGGFAGLTPGTMGGFTPSALGNAFVDGNIVPFARGGIISRPTLFPMANGAGLMGEAGPEGVIPLKRGPGGRLGVSAWGAPANQNNVEINIVTPPGMTAEKQQSKTPSGGQRVDIAIVKMVEAGIASNVARGTGPVSNVLAGKYGPGAARR